MLSKKFPAPVATLGMQAIFCSADEYNDFGQRL